MLVRLMGVLVVSVGILAAAFFGLTKQYTVRSDAMAPTLRKGDHVAVFRFWSTFSSPHRKDVVVFRPEAFTFRRCGKGAIVDRVIGLPGETVSERNGFVSVDGKALKEPYVKAGHRDARTAAWHVPKGEYFLLGDDRRTNCDSRTDGPIPKKNIVGKVFLTFWPFDRVSVG